jgi:hypothetical protein
MCTWLREDIVASSRCRLQNSERACVRAFAGFAGSCGRTAALAQARRLPVLRMFTPLSVDLYGIESPISMQPQPRHSGRAYARSGQA